MPEVINHTRKMQGIINNISTIIITLKYLESVECRSIMTKDIINVERNKATLKFKSLLSAKEALNYEK
jgi:hypothetical protein